MSAALVHFFSFYIYNLTFLSLLGYGVRGVSLARLRHLPGRNGDQLRKRGQFAGIREGFARG